MSSWWIGKDRAHFQEAAAAELPRMLQEDRQRREERRDWLTRGEYRHLLMIEYWRLLNYLRNGTVGHARVGYTPEALPSAKFETKRRPHS